MYIYVYILHIELSLELLWLCSQTIDRALPAQFLVMCVCVCACSSTSLLSSF